MRYNATMGSIGKAYQAATGRKSLQCITPISNVPSIVQRGLLCHNTASRYAHKDASLADVQARRAEVTIERSGRTLHDYANLYFNARNAMMYFLYKNADSFPGDYCVLAVSYDVLDLPGVMVTDMNAAKALASFRAPAEMLKTMNFQRVFAQSWEHEDPREMRLRKGQMCAEVLVPGKIEPSYIKGAFVGDDAAKDRLMQAAPSLRVLKRPALFFN